MPTDRSSTEVDKNVVRVSFNDLRRMGRVSANRTETIQHRRLLRRIRSLLKEAGIAPGAELTVTLRGKEIVMSEDKLDGVKSGDTTGNDLSFESCLAEVLARRDSALRRLAE